MISNLKEQIIKKLPQGSFIRNIITLMTGTIFAQVMNIAVAPILTRLYTPEDFGVYVMCILAVGILTIIVCLRYELAIVLPEKDEDAVNLAVLSILISFGISAVSVVLVALFRTPIADFVGVPELANLLWVIPFHLVIVGLYMVSTHWSTRRKQFKRLATRQMSQSSTTSLIQVVMGLPYVYLGVGGLIIGHIVGQSIATIRLVWQILHDEGEKFKSCVCIENIKQVFSRYRDFPLFSSWGILFNTISLAMPVLLLGYFFTPEIVGWYALSHKVVSMPVSIIGTSISQSFFPRATEACRRGELSTITLKVFTQLVTAGMVPFILLTLVAPELFAIVFGSDWLTSGEYVRWISMWLFMQFISSPLSTIYMVLEKQKEFLIFNLALVVSRLVALSIGGVMGNAGLSIILLGVTGAFLYAMLCFQILHMANVNSCDIVKILVNQIITVLLFASLPIMSLIFFDTSLALSILAGMVFIIYQTNRYWNIL